jgi:hypothetical protein
MKRLALLALLGLSGCFINTDRHRYHDDYYDDRSYTYAPLLSVSWSIDGSTDPAECRYEDVSEISILVETRSGVTIGEYLADCRDFYTSIELDPGRYTANAVLLDGRGNERSTVVDLESFSLASGDELAIDVDFPADSFL